MNSNNAPRTMASPRKTSLWRLRNEVARLVADSLRLGASAQDVLRVVGIGIDAGSLAVPRPVAFMAGEQERREKAA